MSFFVFDLDGTIADCQHRVHHAKGKRPNWRAFFAACVDDKLIPHVKAVLEALVAAGHRVEIWSGRSDEVRAETEAWLEANGIDSARLTRMRRQGDTRRDDIVKREMLRASEGGGGRPDALFDDRDRVVAMWRDEGIPCFQVAPGNF
jgi:phosphoglycolate phosphatase-like HAD superfamily hydrolase